MTIFMRRRPFLLALSAITALGLALRIWSAQGGLWVDEAWSAILVAPIHGPLGVFLAINHDNNHHINSLWMEYCGFGAPPLLLRALSIATGTLTIPVAAAIGARTGDRRGVTSALVTALLFAISPILVNYGSEARGYAPMLLAAVTMIACVVGVLDQPPAHPRRTACLLAMLSLAGMFSHLTMIFFVAAIAIWVAWVFARRMPIDEAIAAMLRLLAPAFGACLLAIAVIAGAAAASPHGMQVGGYVPFSMAAWSAALATMVTTTLGFSFGNENEIAPILILSIAAVAFQSRHRTPMGPFRLVAILGFPLVFPLAQIGNSGMARYYLLAAIALLFLVAEIIAHALGRSLTKGLAACTLAMIVLFCLREDMAQAALRRGDPGAAIEEMKRRAPYGTIVMLDHPRSFAPLRVAAASARYPLAIVEGCPSRRFLLVVLDPEAAAPPEAMRCGRTFRRLIVRRAGALSGVDWALYEKVAQQ